MSRAHYSSYVSHCLRFYARNPQPQFDNVVSFNDWQACDDALNSFNERERSLLLTVYRERDTIPDNVYLLSLTEGIKQDVIWKLINELERRVARSRGLLWQTTETYPKN